MHLHRARAHDLECQFLQRSRLGNRPGSEEEQARRDQNCGHTKPNSHTTEEVFGRHSQTLVAANLENLSRMGVFHSRFGHCYVFDLTSPWRTMSFKAGDRVVYPHHGAAVVEKKEKIEAFGRETEYLVLRMAHGEMTLRVPVDKVDDVGMRWPISGDDVDDLFDVLKKRDVREPSNWSRRFKNHQEKLKSGDVYQVAEVVRNLALRDRDKGLSAGEKTLYQKARSVLVSELSFALDVSEDDAMDKVDGPLE